MKSKKIIHIDMDCFYAQVEMRDRPELSNHPLAIGGLPGTRSVLCTSNYIARKFGVRSAMPTDTAMKLCPSLIVIPPQFYKYEKVSKVINEIFRKYSHCVETVSLDEAYLDVSHVLNASELALQIKDEIFKTTNLTASVGVAPNKFLAKIASDWKKPNGYFVIKPHEIETFVLDLPVKLIPGVGKKSLPVMERLGVRTCRDLRSITPELLAISFGKFSLDLINFSKGKDDREVINHWERKSLSLENTFLKDFNDVTDCTDAFYELYLELGLRLNDHFNHSKKPNKIKKIFVKTKTSDFKQTTVEESLFPFDFSHNHFFHQLPFKSFNRLLQEAFSRKSSTVRLVGLGVRFQTSEEGNSEQLSFISLCA